jgi:hypothetical protein
MSVLSVFIVQINTKKEGYHTVFTFIHKNVKYMIKCMRPHDACEFRSYLGGLFTAYIGTTPRQITISPDYITLSSEFSVDIEQITSILVNDFTSRFAEYTTGPPFSLWNLRIGLKNRSELIFLIGAPEEEQEWIKKNLTFLSRKEDSKV